jgi:hypothetical protein
MHAYVIMVFNFPQFLLTAVFLLGKAWYGLFTWQSMPQKNI